MVRTIEQTTMRKVYLRVLPIAVVSYFFCYLDRINVGFAALTMRGQLPPRTPEDPEMAAYAEMVIQ
jgi:MFS transporter, ACS family, tartrate transporter